MTSSLNASSLAAPFAVRCADANALHPLQLRRRSKWYVRTGRNKEDGSDGRDPNFEDSKRIQRNFEGKGYKVREH